MTPCCPSCGTANVAGTAAVNVCTECVAVNIMGLSLPVAGCIGIALVAIAALLVHRWMERSRAVGSERGRGQGVAAA